MQSPKKSGGIAKYILTLLVAAIASVQVASFGMADLRVYQDMKSDIAEIERRMPRQQDSAGVDPGSVHYAGLGRIVINGEVVQERTPGAPRPAVQPDPGPVQAPEESQPPPQQPPSDTQDPKEDVPQKEEPAKTQSTNQAASSTPTPPKSSGSSGSSGSGQSEDKPNQNSSSSGNSSSSDSWGESSTTNEVTGSLDKDAYWVDGGKSYHFTSGCTSLSKSKNIRSGTLQDALNAGKTDPCNNCAGGS